MLDFIKEVRPDIEWEWQLRWLVAEYTVEDCKYRAIWVITEEREVWEAHPQMIKSLLDQHPLLHPRFIEWSTVEPGKLWDE